MYSSNVVGKVNNGKVVVTMINISEEDKKIKLNEFNKIMYECEEDYELIKMINNNNENNSNRINRINKIKNLICNELGNILEELIEDGVL